MSLNVKVIESINKIKQLEHPTLVPCSYIKPTTKLRDYQIRGVLHLSVLPRMILGDGVGLGKTVQILVSYCYKLMLKPGLKLLVVTPKSAMEQWKEEAEKFCTNIKAYVLSNRIAVKIDDPLVFGCPEKLKDQNIKCKILSGFEARKFQYENVKDDILICNYRAIQEDYNFIIENRMPFFQVVFDEVQEIKNDRTKTWFAASMIAEKASYVYGVSATIIKNKLEEAYNIYRVVVPGLFPGKIVFHREYIIKKKMSVWQRNRGRKRYFNKIIGYKNLDKFREIISPYFLIRKASEVASELPKLASRKLILDMTPEQEKLYKKALSGELYQKIAKERYFTLKEKMDAGEDIDIGKFEAAQKKYEESLTKDGLFKNKIAALSYCQLVSNGPGWIGEEGESSKEIEFKRLFEQELSDEKTIVFTRFKSGINRLMKILDEIGIKHVKITGDEDTRQRETAKKLFQDLNNDYRVIFITQAGSAAINLQAARVILYYDTPWSYGDLYQSIGRAQRIGNLNNHILLLHMVNTTTIDEHVLKILEHKKDLINNVIGDIAEGAIEFKEDNIIFKDDESENVINQLYTSVFG